MAPIKRGRQPKMTTQALLDFDLEESSSDSDFRIEDHKASDDDFSDVSKDDESNKSGDSDEDDESTSEEDIDDSDDFSGEIRDLFMNEPQMNGVQNCESLLKKLSTCQGIGSNIPTKPICCVCLGDRSDDSNEIIECDGCGVSVHEGCYGVSDNVSISSTNSTCSTEPWFCEACRAGVSGPICELCPNKGGIYKETDVGKWVHLVCALYVPGVAFGEVDQLSSVTLFEMQYSKWGAKICSLCEQSRFARTGVCIGCDAGMCKTYFHVTCAQAAGFLTEAHHEEAEAADPFYAHCKVHSEKELIKKRKRNFHTFRLNMQQKIEEKQEQRYDDPCPAQMRIQRKLLKYQRKYSNHKIMKSEPWVPTQKMSRLLTTSASACRRLLAKADLMSMDVEALERQEAQIAVLTDIRKKWHIPPALSVEFIGYYLDRISRLKELKQQLSKMVDNNATLSQEQDALRSEYDSRLEKNKDLKTQQDSLMSHVVQLQNQICILCPSKTLPAPSNIGRPYVEPFKAATPPTRPISVPTAAALKMGVGFPLAHLGPPGTKVDSTRLLSTHVKSSPNGILATSAPTTPTVGVQSLDCGICKSAANQHLLAKCDTCQMHYHLGCLNPPLARHPKKSKLYGWQCSECDKSEESDSVSDLPKGPRKSRTRFNKDGAIVHVDTSDQLPEMKNESSEMVTAKRKQSDMKVSVAVVASLANNNNNNKRSLNKSTPETLDCHSNNDNSSTLSPFTRKSIIILNYSTGKNEPTTESSDGMVESPLKADMSMKKVKTDTTTGNVPATESVILLVATNDAPRVVEASQAPHDYDPLTLPSVAILNADATADQNKASRKQKRKDKHRSKQNVSSDVDKSPVKERKRKRKKKLHDHSNDNPADSNGVPKIKIKFKTLPLPGEVTPEAQFFYVSADMVRSAEEASRPTSVETVEESPTLGDGAPTSIENAPTIVSNKRKSTPRTINQRKTLMGRSRAVSTSSLQLKCCVCNETGVSGNVVTCDECFKHYHFTCLDPPVRKTPKIRGYSWHCADCDPTDEERI